MTDKTGKVDTIRLVSSVWNYEGLRENDPYLSDLIPPIETLEGVDEVVIPELLARIIASQWDSYLAMWKMMDDEILVSFQYKGRSNIRSVTRDRSKITATRVVTIGNVLEGTDVMSPPYDSLSIGVTITYSGVTRYGAGAMNNEANVLTAIFYSSPYNIVYLTDIDHIVRILNVPVGWQYLVSVNESTEQSERIRHLREVGAIVSESPILREQFSFLVTAHIPALAQALVAKMLGGVGLIDPTVFNPGAVFSLPPNSDSPYARFVMGVVVNQSRRVGYDKNLVNSYNETDGLDYAGIIWDDVVAGMELIARETSVPNPFTPEFMNTLTYLAGTRNTPWSPIQHTLDILGPILQYEPIPVTFGSRATNAQIRAQIPLYDMLLRYLPDDIDPYVIGLRTVLDRSNLQYVGIGGRVHDIHSAVAIPPPAWIGTIIEDMIEPFTEKTATNEYGRFGVPQVLEISLDTRHFRKVVKELSLMGTYVMSRILISLLSYIDSKEGEPRAQVTRADMFASEIERWFERGGRI